MIIKVGLLLDSLVVPAWQQQIIIFIKNHPSLSIEVVIVNDSKRKRSYTSRIFYKLLRRVDRSLFKSSWDNFKLLQVDSELKGTAILRVNPIQKKIRDEFSLADLLLVTEKQLDIICRFGFRVLQGGILNSARYGVWSLHHGDSSVNRGGPPGFWEVVNKEPVTGVTLQVLTDSLDGGTVLGKSFINTDQTSFNRNQNAAFSAGIELFCSKLQELGTIGPGRFFERMKEESQGNVGLYSRPLYRDPFNMLAFSLTLSFFLGRAGSFIRNMVSVQQWIILYRLNQVGIEKALYRYKKMVPPRGSDWADPFVIFKDDHYYVFFEEFTHSIVKAHISCFIFDKKGRAISDKPMEILKEPHHLSYPFIFSYQDSFFMLPEGAACKTVWLYRSVSFPEKWERYKALLQEELFDPTLIHHHGHWYLFGTKRPFPGNSAHQFLYIYFTEDLLHGEWKAHPLNPVTRDIRGARPAGRIFEYDGMLLRPAQIGTPKYGHGIRFQQIIELTPDRYKEKPLEDIMPLWEDKLLATHTFNSDNGFTVLDAQYYKRRL